MSAHEFAYQSGNGKFHCKFCTVEYNYTESTRKCASAPKAQLLNDDRRLKQDLGPFYCLFWIAVKCADCCVRPDGECCTKKRGRSRRSGSAPSNQKMSS